MTLEQEAKLIELRAMGLSVQYSADQAGLPKTTALRALSRDDIKSRVQDLQERTITHLSDDSFNNIQFVIQSYQPAFALAKGDDRFYQLRDHGFKASMKVMETIGAFPASTPSVFIQNIFSQSLNVLPQVITDILSHLTRTDAQSDGNLLADSDVIDLPGGGTSIG